jgi:GAF domain-containing protein
MKRRDQTDRKAAKTRRRNALKRRGAPKARRRPPAASKETNVARLTRERNEALEQLAATSEVLKVISSSTVELEPVFTAILANATRICEAKFGTLYLRDEGGITLVASHNVAFAETRRGKPYNPPPGTALGEAYRTKQPARIADLAATRPYIERHPEIVQAVEVGGVRSGVSVPLLKGDELIGLIGIFRQEVRPFTDKQIELVQNFAAQAVIAIENTRLLSELRESLQQQTATADVLKVISRSTFDLQKVLDTLVESAARLCRADRTAIRLVRDNLYYNSASFGFLDDHKERMKGEPLKPGRGSIVGRVALERKSVHIIDGQADADPNVASRSRSGNVRTVLGVPLLREETPIGVLLLQRSIVQSFTDKEIELAETFADQAVIAIENVRLFDEVQVRTRDLTESLQQQTATADVLKVISSSQGELEPVFQTMLANAVRICGAKFGIMHRYENDGFCLVAAYDTPAALVEYQRSRGAFQPRLGTPLEQVWRTKEAVQIADDAAGSNPSALATLGGARSHMVVPMLKDNELVGAIAIYRQEVKPFTDKQIDLVKNFAAQAVIAIENTRLLKELRESLQQQTATADVLKVISRSTFDLQTVLQTLVESAARLCDADKGNITREKNGVFYRAAESYGHSREFLDHIRSLPIESSQGSATGRALFERRVIHIPDVKADAEYTLVDAQKLGDYRSILAVPMLREGVVLGVLTLTRSEVRPFTDKQIELVRTFADQAAIAIENVRLFDEVQTRTRDLAKSLEELRTTQDRLVQTQKLALLGQLTAGIAHEIKNPLNFVNNFSGISAELIGELRDSLKGIPLDDKARTEINELTDTLKSNFDKVVHHGRRADAIVKNMLQHSREGSGEHRVIDINALVEESLNLAWHGARAETQGFEVKLKQSFDPSAGEADVFPQDIRRALLNLIANGFYAATRRRAETNGGDYEPTLTASTKNLGDRVEISIRDNGTGIAPDVKEKIFEPFFTTKPTGEGTGLGLSISHDIIVKQHAGSIEVDTQLGEFTDIRIILPRTAVFV